MTMGCRNARRGLHFCIFARAYGPPRPGTMAAADALERGLVRIRLPAAIGCSAFGKTRGLTTAAARESNANEGLGSILFAFVWTLHAADLRANLRFWENFLFGCSITMQMPLVFRAAE